VSIVVVTRRILARIQRLSDESSCVPCLGRATVKEHQVLTTDRELTEIKSIRCRISD